MKATMEWQTYRTRFLVKAKQLSSNLSFVDPLGRRHSGRKGDYLVESADGMFRIAPQQIFEDVYVAMQMIERGAIPSLAKSAIDRRKCPQPYRERRPAGTGLRLL